jgi:Spherulation-specific family 4.
VYTVGYIKIDYCRKPHSECFAEVEQYAGWSEQYEAIGLGVRGIFVDETPNHHDTDRAEYLSVLTQFIKSTPGIMSDRFVRLPTPEIYARDNRTDH